MYHDLVGGGDQQHWTNIYLSEVDERELWGQQAVQ